MILSWFVSEAIYTNLLYFLCIIIEHKTCSGSWRGSEVKRHEDTCCQERANPSLCRTTACRCWDVSTLHFKVKICWRDKEVLSPHPRLLWFSSPLKILTCFYHAGLTYDFLQVYIACILDWMDHWHRLFSIQNAMPDQIKTPAPIFVPFRNQRTLKSGYFCVCRGTRLQVFENGNIKAGQFWTEVKRHNQLWPHRFSYANSGRFVWFPL